MGVGLIEVLQAFERWLARGWSRLIGYLGPPG
jgi:hypothetical protein